MRLIAPTRAMWRLFFDTYRCIEGVSCRRIAMILADMGSEEVLELGVISARPGDNMLTVIMLRPERAPDPFLEGFGTRGKKRHQQGSL